MVPVISLAIALSDYAGGSEPRDDSLNYRPDADRFSARNLTGPLDEPVSMDIRSDGAVWIVERAGGIKRWSEESGVENFGPLDDVYAPEGLEFGLIGVASYPSGGPTEGLFLMYNTIVGLAKPVKQLRGRPTSKEN